MKEEVKNLLEKYVKIREIKVNKHKVCIVYIEEIMLTNTFFDALKDYYYTIWYSGTMESMGLTLLKK